MTNDQWIGLATLIAGILILIWTKKTWIKGDDIFTSNAKGIIGGGAFIIIGIMLITGQIHWK